MNVIIPDILFYALIAGLGVFGIIAIVAMALFFKAGFGNILSLARSKNKDKILLIVASNQGVDFDVADYTPQFFKSKKYGMFLNSSFNEESAVKVMSDGRKVAIVSPDFGVAMPTKFVSVLELLSKLKVDTTEKLKEIVEGLEKNDKKILEKYKELKEWIVKAKVDEKIEKEKKATKVIKEYRIILPLFKAISFNSIAKFFEKNLNPAYVDSLVEHKLSAELDTYKNLNMGGGFVAKYGSFILLAIIFGAVGFAIVSNVLDFQGLEKKYLATQEELAKCQAKLEYLPQTGLLPTTPTTQPTQQQSKINVPPKTQPVKESGGA